MIPMPQHVTVWHGSDADLFKLRTAVEHNCECRVSSVEDPMPPTCSAHSMLTDQRILDHLVLVGKERKRFWHGEFDSIAEWF